MEGYLTIDYVQRRVNLTGRPVRVTALEYCLLVKLLVSAGRTLTYDHLPQGVWGLREQRGPETHTGRREEHPAQSWGTTPATLPTSSPNPGLATAWGRTRRRVRSKH